MGVPPREGCSCRSHWKSVPLDQRLGGAWARQLLPHDGDDASRQFLGGYVTAELTDTGKLVAVFSHGAADTASPSRFGRGLVLYVEP